MEARLKYYYKRALKAGACPYSLAVMESSGTVERFLKHERAPSWLCWYAKYVRKRRWKAAEPYMATCYNVLLLYAAWFGIPIKEVLDGSD